jgi:hypothetical protein
LNEILDIQPCVKLLTLFCGNEAKLGGNEQVLSANNLTLFKCSPITLCDVDRSFPGIGFYLVTIGGISSLTILKCMSSSTATLLKTKAKLRYEFFIIVKSKYISPFITQKVDSVYV